MSGNARFFGIFSFFFASRGSGGEAMRGFGGCTAVRLDFWGGFGGSVLSGFARIFGYLVAAGALKGSTVSRPLRRRMVGRMGWVAG